MFSIHQLTARPTTEEKKSLLCLEEETDQTQHSMKQPSLKFILHCQREKVLRALRQDILARYFLIAIKSITKYHILKQCNLNLNE